MSSGRGYTFTLSSKKFEIHNQDNIPIQLIDSERVLAYDSQIFTAAEYFYEWDPIIFREINDNKDAYGNGESSFIKKEDFYNDIKRIDENTVIKFLVKFEYAGIGKIVEFKRTKKNFLEVIANICSLFLSLHSLFGILLTYYARRFNNYQILKKVINLKNTKEDNQILIY